jgi:hypothetical protein
MVDISNIIFGDSPSELNLREKTRSAWQGKPIYAQFQDSSDGFHLSENKMHVDEY